MGRVTVVLNGKARREQVCRWVMNAPLNTRVEMKDAKRSLPQNDRMWAMLTDVAKSVEWHGLKLSTEDWKLIFLDALKREVRMVPNLDGNGFISLGRSSSDLSKQEMGDLMTLIEAFGAQHDVQFHDGDRAAAGDNLAAEVAA